MAMAMTLFDSHSLNFIYGHDYDYAWLTHSLNFIYGHGYDYVWVTQSKLMCVSQT
jgi:hypothetical protein